MFIKSGINIKNYMYIEFQLLLIFHLKYLYIEEDYQ